MSIFYSNFVYFWSFFRHLFMEFWVNFRSILYSNFVNFRLIQSIINQSGAQRPHEPTARATDSVIAVGGFEWRWQWRGPVQNWFHRRFGDVDLHFVHSGPVDGEDDRQRRRFHRFTLPSVRLRRLLEAVPRVVCCPTTPTARNTSFTNCWLLEYTLTAV